MRRIILRIRPAEVMDDLDIEAVRTRVNLLADWEAEVQDTRLSDAPYVTVVATTEMFDANAAEQLKKAFADMPRMQAQVWRRSKSEVPLDFADSSLLEEAAELIR